MIIVKRICSEPDDMRSKLAALILSEKLRVNKYLENKALVRPCFDPAVPYRVRTCD